MYPKLHYIFHLNLQRWFSFPFPSRSQFHFYRFCFQVFISLLPNIAHQYRKAGHIAKTASCMIHLHIYSHNHFQMMKFIRHNQPLLPDPSKRLLHLIPLFNLEGMFPPNLQYLLLHIWDDFQMTPLLLSMTKVKENCCYL